MDKIVCGYRMEKDLKSGLPIHYVSYIMRTQSFWYTEKLLLKSSPVENKVEWLGSRSDIQGRLLGDMNHIDADFDVQVTLQNVNRCRPTLSIIPSQASPQCFVFLKKTRWFSSLALTDECKIQVFNGIVTAVDHLNLSSSQILLKLNACREEECSLTDLPRGKWISSEFIRSWNMSYFKPFAPIRHGPAAQALHIEEVCSEAFDFDFVPYIHFEGWPELASEWITRVRLNNWPTTDIISEVVKCGFGLTPVGYDNNTTMTNYEWRMSFSKAENMLFKKMDFEKFVFFAMVKFLIKSSDVDRDILKSYYLKNLYFWYMEKVPSVHMYRKNFGILFINFLDEILLCLSDKKISQYFIPSVNLIETMTNKNRVSLYNQINNFRLNFIKTLEKSLQEPQAAGFILPVFHSYESMYTSHGFRQIMAHWTSSIWVSLMMLYSEYDGRPAILYDIVSLHYCRIKIIEEYFQCFNDIGQLHMSLYIPLRHLDDLKLFRHLPLDVIAQCLLVLHCIGFLFCKSSKLDLGRLKIPTSPNSNIYTTDFYRKGHILTSNEKNIIRIQVLTQLYRILSKSTVNTEYTLALKNISKQVEIVNFPSGHLYDKSLVFPMFNRDYNRKKDILKKFTAHLQSTNQFAEACTKWIKTKNPNINT